LTLHDLGYDITRKYTDKLVIQSKN